MLFRALNLKVPRLGKNRHGVFYVRSSIADDSKGRKVVQQSLGTKDPQQAKILALQFCLTLAQGNLVSNFPRDFSQYTVTADGSVSADGPEDHALAMQAKRLQHEQQMEIYRMQGTLAQVMPTASYPVIQVAAAKVTLDANSPELLQNAFANHLSEEARRVKAAQTVGEKRVLYKEFVDCFGNVQINSIKTTDIAQIWRRVEINRPNKKRPTEKLSLGRLEKRRGYLSKFFTWAIEGGLYLHAHPAKQRMASKKEIQSATKSYEEFTGDDLHSLFSESYAQKMKTPDFYWLPLLSLFSGARLSEVANLALSDFAITEGIHCYRITDGKTIDSRRLVPIHSRLLELGLWEYVELLRSLKQTHLIPHRSALKREKAVGRAWGIWVDKCGITNKQKVFHSFRPTVITDLHNANAGHATIKRTVGHATQGMSGAHGGYVRGIDLVNHKTTVEKLIHSTIDFSSLKLVDPAFTTFFDKFFKIRTDLILDAKAEKQRNHDAVKAERLLRQSKMRIKRPISKELDV